MRILKLLFLDLGILNSSIGSANLGDLIIYESVYENLRKVFHSDFFTNYPTQLHTSFDAKYLMSQKKLLFISGTNLLSSNLEARYQWKIESSHRKFLNNKVVLLGVGWWQYQGEINGYTSKIYNSVLSKDVIHSVRDSYSVNKLNSIGIENVINTSCPTLWGIYPEKCKKISTTKAENVVTTLTHYKKSHKDDGTMLKILSANYKTVYLWIQSYADLLYLDEIDPKGKNIVLVPPTLEAYDELLAKGKIDYIGTRLHAGIRALQNDHRTLILAVDNRAIEISNDVNLNVIKREDVNEVVHFINKPYETMIKLPEKNIALFKESLVKFRGENTIDKISI
ncbi:MAG: polysaccharide pyruvyl transferase family protein [Draconibacterium sp.]